MFELKYIFGLFLFTQTIFAINMSHSNHKTNFKISSGEKYLIELIDWNASVQSKVPIVTGWTPEKLQVL